jgi:hypothetical protein
MMQRTADFHHHVANSGFPHPNGLFQRTAAFHTAVDLFDADAPPRDFPRLSRNSREVRTSFEGRPNSSNGLA